MRKSTPGSSIRRKRHMMLEDIGHALSVSIASASVRRFVPSRAFGPVIDANSARVYQNSSCTTDRSHKLNTLSSVWQSIARTSYQTKQRVATEQALSRAEALRCATANGAYLTFDEDKKGSLQVGRFADLAVLSADPLTVAEPDIANIAARMTMVGGKIVHETPNWSG
jgi:adenine deaminase